MNLASLLLTEGPQAITMVDNLINTLETKGSVTSDEWASIRAKGKTSAQDLMLAQLQKAGVDPASAQGQALLAAAS